MPVKRHEQSGAKKRKKEKKDEKEARASLLVHIHNPVKLFWFWVLRLITCFNVGNNLTTTNASNILGVSMFTYESHGFNTNNNNKK